MKSNAAAGKPVLRVVRSYERKPEAARPFRIFDNRNGAELPHRCYKDEQTAIDRAYVLAKWDLRVGESYDVASVHDGHWRATYKRTLDGVKIMEHERIAKERMRRLKERENNG